MKDLKNWKEKEDDERRGMCSYAKQSAEIFPKKDLREAWNNYTSDRSKKNQVETRKTAWQRAVNIASWVSLILCGILAVWSYQSGIFRIGGDYAAVCEPFRNDRCTDLRADPDRSGGVSHHTGWHQLSGRSAALWSGARIFTIIYIGICVVPVLLLE